MNFFGSQFSAEISKSIPNFSSSQYFRNLPTISQKKMQWKIFYRFFIFLTNFSKIPENIIYDLLIYKIAMSWILKLIQKREKRAFTSKFWVRFPSIHPFVFIDQTTQCHKKGFLIKILKNLRWLVNWDQGFFLAKEEFRNWCTERKIS